METIVQGLQDKRAALEERLATLSAEMAETQRQMAAIDTVIAMYDPDWKPATAVARRRKPKTEAGMAFDAALGGVNKRQAVLSVLRDADHPLSTAECAAEIAARNGIAADDRVLPIIGNRISAVLDALRKTGRVRHADDGEDRAPGHKRLWEIAS